MSARGTQTPPRRLTRYIPVVLAVLILGVIFVEYSPERIAQHAFQGQWLWLFPIALVTVCLGLVLVALADTLTIRHGARPIPFNVVLRGKAGTSILDALGYAASHGGYAFWIARRVGISAQRAGGVLLYIMATDLAAVCWVAAIPILFFPVGVSTTVVWVVPSIAGLITVLYLMPARWRGEGSGSQWREPWWKISRRVALTQLGLRSAQIVVWVVATWVAANSFGLKIPLAAMGVIAPVILLATALPMNVAGFGVAQSAWLLFDHFAPAEKLLAFGFVWNCVLALAVVIRGLPFIQRTLREVSSPPQDIKRSDVNNSENGDARVYAV